MNGNSPHTQIDTLIMKNDAFAPIQKLNQMIKAFPLMDSTAVSELLKMIGEGGDTLDASIFLKDFSSVDEQSQILSDLRYTGSLSPEMIVKEQTGELNPTAVSNRLNE